MKYTRSHSIFSSKAAVGLLTLVIMAACLAVLTAGRQASAARNDLLNPFSPRLAAIQNDQPSVGPGVPQVGSNAPKSAASNTKAGSLLFLPRYTSSNSNPGSVNTIISLTNTNPRDGVTVRIFFVRDCQVNNMFLNLAANQTRTLLASTEDPGKTGYLIASAVNSQGIPTQFNWLIGSASIITGRDANGREASYNAVSVAKRTAGAINVSEGAISATVKFNDTDYDRLPQAIALDQIQNQDPNLGSTPQSAVRTDVSLFSPLTDLGGNTSQALKMTAIAYDQSGRPYPQIVDSACGLNAPVSNIWTAPALGSFITPDRAGWGSFAAQVEGTPVPLLGVSFTDGIGDAHNSARHMQVLSRLDSFSMKVPIAAPPIPANDVATSNLPDAPGGSLGASEMKAGSALIFSRFTSGTFGNSQIVITNTHPTQKARLRIFFTGLADSTLMTDAIISLFPNQTTTINPQDFAANQKGWLFAMAIDARALPLNFNFLIGSARVKEQNGASFGYNALAVAKNAPGVVPRNDDIQTSDLKFDGTNYDRLPATLAIAGLPSQQDNTTTLGYARPPANILDPVNARGSVVSTVYDELLAMASATAGGLEVRVGNLKPSVNAQPITTTILKGHRGWMKLTPGAPIFAWMANLPTTAFTAQTASSNWTGGLKGGATLHVLANADSYLLKTASTNPNNHAPTANFETINYGIEARGIKGTIVRLDGRSSTDPDEGDALTYKWYDGETLISSAPISDFRLSIGSHTLKLIVTDGSALSSEPMVTLVEVVDTTAPVMSGIPSKISKTTSSNVGSTVTYALPVAYDSVDGNVTVKSSVLPSYLFAIGKTIVTFTARDNAGNESKATMEVEVKKGGGNFPQTGGTASNKLPVTANLNDQYVVVDKQREITLQATDAENDPVTFTLQGAPDYARLDAIDPVARQAKLILAPHPGDQAVATNVRIVATDSKGGSYHSLYFRIQLSDIENDDTGSGNGPGGPREGDGDGGGGGGGGGNTNNAPTARMSALAATVQATSKQGAVVELNGSQSSDPDLDPLSYVWKNGDAVIAEGAIVSTTLPVGIHSITLTVSDGKGGVNTAVPQSIEVLPRTLTIISASPAKLSTFNTMMVTITGTGFNQGTQARFDCTSFCQGGSQVAVTIVSIEEDIIVLSAKTTQKTPLGNRDAVVTNPNGTSAKLSRSNYVSQ
ncbi:MAG: PKD domain-containing protein [Acidobacteriota bacterium]|nr:PKD domain-containing protein [Acidobacteriota bacterium]